MPLTAKLIRLALAVLMLGGLVLLERAGRNPGRRALLYRLVLPAAVMVTVAVCSFPWAPPEQASQPEPADPPTETETAEECDARQSP